MRTRPILRALFSTLIFLSTPIAIARAQGTDTTVTVSPEPAVRAIAVSGPVDMGEARLLFAPGGAGPGEQFGNAVAKAGDVNGDGYDDVIVGAWTADPYDIGRAYIFYGGPAADTSPDVSLIGEAAENNFGTSVAGAGDVNGDGYDDVIVGAWLYGGERGPGRAYIFYGGPSPDTQADLVLNGEASGDQFGVDVASAGDINGDGYGDVIVGAPDNDAGGPGAGRAYIYLGGPQPDTNPDVVLTSYGGDGGKFGWAVSSAGDWNTDGYSDVIVGAHAAGGSGRAYVYFGGPAMDNIPDRTLSGEALGDRFGISVASAHDINGDGYADVIVSADSNDAGAPGAGRVYVFFGGPYADGTPDRVFTSTNAGENMGNSVASAGDLNGDAYDDVIAGAWYSDYTGRAYIYFGGPSGDLLPDVTVRGEGAYDRFGIAVAGAGDMDADGHQDFVVGAYFNDVNGADAGRAYIMTIGSGPIVHAPLTAEVDAGTLLAFTVTASDPDGEPITSLIATPLPSGATFTSNADHTSGDFRWTPTTAQAGDHDVTFRASNTLSGSATTRIHVVYLNRPPVLDPIAAVVMNEGEVWNQVVHAVDPEGDILSFTLSSGPAFASVTTLDAMTGNLHLAPGFDDAGGYTVTVQAADGRGGTALASVPVTVNMVNRPPVLAVPSGVFGAESVPISFSITATDPDGDGIRLGALNRPVGSLFIDLGNGTGNFNWTPGFGQAGTYIVTFTARDALGAVGTPRDLEIVIDEVNRGPLANAGGPYAGVINVPVFFNGTGSSDPDGSPLTYQWNFGDSMNGVGVTPAHSYSSGGVFTVTLTVSDGALTDGASTIATVEDTFQARAFTTKSNSTIKLGAGKSTWCAELEPVADAFLATAVIQSSIAMQYGSGRVYAQANKVSIDGDKDGNGVQEMSACFAKTDLRTLFGNLPKGTSTVTVELSGDLTTGGRFQANLTVDVAGTNNLAASLTPNPLHPDGTFTFSTSQAGRLAVSIFDLHGRLVRKLEPGAEYQAGYHDFRFDGRGDRGDPLPSGVYFYRIQAAEGVGTGQFVIAR